MVECAITGAPDPIRGQVVKATIVLAKGYEGTPELTKELQNHVKHATAPYKYPRVIEYVDELPKTIGGKIKRAQIAKPTRGEGPVPGLSIRANGQLAAARAHRENSARARGLHPRQFAPWGGELAHACANRLARVRAGGGLPSRAPFKHRKGHPSWFGCPFCLGRKNCSVSLFIRPPLCYSKLVKKEAAKRRQERSFCMYKFDRQEYDQRMAWYTDARFGMFIHWGLYAIPARGEWVRSVEEMPKEDYMPFFHQF